MSYHSSQHYIEPAPVQQGGNRYRCWKGRNKTMSVCRGPDAGRDWEQEEKATSEDEMAGWHHRFDGREFE